MSQDQFSTLVTRIRLVCGAVFFIVLIGCGISLTADKMQRDTFRAKALHAKGVVTQVEEATQQAPRFKQTYVTSETISFQFDIESQTVDAREFFSGDTTFFVGQPVPILYQPDNPTDALIAVNEDNEKTSDIVRFLLLAMGVLMGVLLFVPLQQPFQNPGQETNSQRRL